MKKKCEKCKRDLPLDTSSSVYACTAGTGCADCQKLERERDDLIASLNFHAGLNKDLIRERDEAVRSCHIWQTGHAELVAERDYLLNLLQPNNSKQ